MMNIKKESLFVVIVVCVIIVLNPQILCAQTAESIVKSLLNNYSTLNSYEASLDMYSNLTDIENMSESLILWKRNSQGKHKQFINLGSPYWTAIARNADKWIVKDMNGQKFMVKPDAVQETLRSYGAADLFLLIDAIISEKWSIDSKKIIVNSTECLRLFTEKENNNIEMWVDTFSLKKVIRVRSTDKNNNPEWQLDYLDYQKIQNKLWLPYTIKIKSLENKFKMTYSLTNIDINKTIPDSVFELSS